MQFCNLDINIFNKEELFCLKEGETKFIETVNAQIIVLANTNADVMKTMQMSYKSLDGEIPLKVAKKKNRIFKKCEKLSGSEIVYDFCQYAKENNLRLFFLGGAEESINQAIRVIKDKYGITVSGFSPRYEKYPFSNQFVNSSLEAIRLFKPDILFLGFGVPKQNFFARDYKNEIEELGIKYVIYAGGTVDFVAGKFKKCPEWMSNIGMESLYRLFQEFSWKRIYRILFSFRFFKYVNRRPEFEKKGIGK